MTLVIMINLNDLTITTTIFKSGNSLALRLSKKIRHF